MFFRLKVYYFFLLYLLEVGWDEYKHKDEILFKIEQRLLE